MKAMFCLLINHLIPLDTYMPRNHVLESYEMTTVNEMPVQRAVPRPVVPVTKAVVPFFQAVVPFYQAVVPYSTQSAQAAVCVFVCLVLNDASTLVGH